MKNPSALPDPIADARGKLAALLAERRAVKSADKAEADAIADQIVELDERLARFVDGLNLSGRLSAPPGATPMHQADLFEGDSAFDVALFLQPELVKTRVVEQIRREYQGRAAGLPAKQRAARIQALDEELLVAFRQEELAIRTSERDGRTVERRSEVPAALFVAVDPARVALDDIQSDLEELG